ncbi:MAG: hypothetical protein KF746_26915 [Chitinophagaceae bacterium]|nr:hypothetical protein [Chitinophagaceae bacterium]
MPINNPDILHPLLDELSQKVRNLNHRISYTIDDAEQLKNISSDQTSQATFDTNHTSDVKANDESKIRYWENETTQLIAKTNDLIVRVNDNEAKFKRIQIAVNQSISYWNSELIIAQKKLAEWQAYRNKAVQGMNIAQANYNRADADRRAAVNAYHNCMDAKDSQGRPLNRNCSGYQSQIYAAESAMQQAQQEYRYWEQEKIKAEAEIRKWEARIAKCNDSLHKLSQALTAANSGLQLIHEAADYSQRSLEELNSAKALVVKAQEKNAEQDALVAQNLANIQAAQTLSDHSKSSFIAANKLASQVQFYGSSASAEINRKVDDLKEFSIIPNSL